MPYAAVPFEMTNHRDALVKLWTENLSDRAMGQVAGERLQWIYGENPNGPSKTMLAVETNSQAVIGCGSYFPWNKWVDGKMMRVGTLNDFAVHKDHRVAGAAIAIQRALATGSKAAGFDFITGYPNKNSVLLFDRIGYQRLGDCYHWVKPLRTAYKIKQYIKVPPFGWLASLVVDAALLGNDARKLVRRAFDFTSDVVERADASFDDLWERARFRHRILGDRSSTYLNWRYAGSRTIKYWFYRLKERKTGRLAGFVVFTRPPDRRVGIADVMATGAEDDVLDDLLLRFAARMRLEGQEALVIPFLGASHFERRLSRLNFIRREDQPRTLIVYLDKKAPEELRPVVLDKENWMLFEGEMDL